MKYVKKTWRVSLSIGISVAMIRCVVYLLRIFKMFHGLMNNPVYEGIQSNTTCYSFSNGVYYTLSDMFRPIYNGHLQVSILGGVVNTIQL